MKLWLFLIFLGALDAHAYPFAGIKFLDDEQKMSIDYQVDAYYSQIAFNKDFIANLGPI